MKKKRQRNTEYNALKVNKVPSWRGKGRKRARNVATYSESESGTDNKKSKTLEDEKQFMEAFQTGDERTPFYACTVDNEEDVLDNEEDQEIRTCSASFLSLIRSDLPEDIKEAFMKTLEEKLTLATDCIIDFSKQQYKMTTLLKTSTFVKEDDDIKLQQRSGRKLQDVLPPNYQLKENSGVFFYRLLWIIVVWSKNHWNVTSVVFLLNLIFSHSTYFGPQGLKEGPLKSCPFYASFLHFIPRDLPSMTTTDPYAMKMAFSKYIISFENMW
ncbi:hypothetical protein EDC94DRAFT_676011 [Helicostylum pulchrum]|nr:hypothetical protein EDC94DRAFT_676011 [Helicostylum pulchrum]